MLARGLGGPEDFVGLKEPSPRISYLHPAPETDREAERQRDGKTERQRETERGKEGVSESCTRERLTESRIYTPIYTPHVHRATASAPVFEAFSYCLFKDIRNTGS